MSQKDIVKTLIDRQGALYSEAMGAAIGRTALFHWLLGALLLSARIASKHAIEAGSALKRERLHTIKAILASKRDRRIKVLNKNGYARYDNITADYIFETAKLVDEKYGGDLRSLREKAGGDEERAISLLKEAKGIGDVGADIYLREAQWVWDEYYPRMNGPAVKAAKSFGLPTKAEALARLAGLKEGFVRLGAAPTRAELDDAADEVKVAAGK